MIEWLANSADSVWAYFVLFVLAAAPWLEVFLVVPLGIAVGMNPVGVAVTGFIGNWIPILLIGLFFRQLSVWRGKRRVRKLREQGIDPEQIQEPSKKQQRARRIWDKYGIPGLAILAPTIVGTDIAAILALSFGSNRTSVMVWMTISLALWTIILAVGAVYGFSYINWTA